MSKIIFLSLLGLIGSISAQYIQDGRCDPNIPTVTDFEIERFLGSWYEISRAPNTTQEADCSTIEIAGINTTLTYRNVAIHKNFLEEVSGTATLENGTSRFTLNLTVGNTVSLDFWILLTDYDNFALAYRCEDITTSQRRVYIWQLGRTSSFPNQLMPALMNATLINQLGIDAGSLYELDHSDLACYQLPVIEAAQPIILPGQCDQNITIAQDFDAANFTGVWHEIASYFSESAVGTCARAEYTLSNGVVNVRNSQVLNQTLEVITGTATVNSTDGSAKLSVVLEVTPNVFLTQELWVLATDYDNYAVSYSCVNVNATNMRIFSWILSRNKTLSDASQTEVTEVVDSILELNNAYFQPTDQTDNGCFYFPEPIPDQTVVFPGQCDMTIPAVTNFDPVRYMGLWHEIESYPSTFQTGTCNNAEYTLVGGVVDVYNTQVINQTLDTIDGQAVIASDDGTAKLRVTFPVAGTNFTVTTDYWVLATDYDNYALVYTCENITPDTRMIWSWKLSRTKSMPAVGTTAINAVINTIPVLNPIYYQTSDQSEAGCFYFPEPQPGVPVVFPGQCDNTVAAVSDFSLLQFAGTWYEIEAFPKDDETGQCVSHVYAQGTGNSLTLQSFSVTDQFLGISDSTVAFNTTDGSGKLIISITTGGQVIQIPFWVLTVDYNNYAFAYSCVNLNSDFRGVYSWKLSRTRQLTAAANTAINTTINDVQVLDNHYYENIDHSDDACFFLPELPPGSPVILDGQCDTNISVVQNFDAVRYQGLWNLVESYPSEFQNGSCNDATYTIQTDGSVLVFNTQVINQQLDTITGSATLATTDGSAKLIVTFPNAPAPIEYWVLDTDYDSYALVYSCVNINTQQRQVWSWKMSRTRSLTANATAAINQVINSIQVLNNRYYEVINNTDADCFYYPTPDGSPVVYRGQCDDTIPAVANFNAVAYMGLWYDIESYPQVFQDGTCSTATYSLIPEGVNVFNTQVVNQRLDTITGLAVVASTDGSAKLSVNFPVSGTNFTVGAPYWVLSTDYTNYALVYACVNLTSDSRSVSSWKLSRTRTLTSSSEVAINNVINTIPVLSQQYYENKNHTDAGCFYFPEPVAGEPVIFPGQCDNNMQAVPNFNMTQFQGTWHEIEAYPKDDQTGQCVNHVYTAGTGNTMNLQSSSVLDQLQTLTSSSVAFSSNDGSGRLIITLSSNNQTIVIPFWVLDTDYNYALAYSCVNLNANFRAVYSWKLSRTRELSAAANTSINSAIANIEVLDNIYYENINQSDNDCFFLPDLEPGEPVILVGQCDPNISVAQNFDAARYQGLWHLVESYPSEFQNGTCNDATYTIQSNGTVLVFNTQVVNQQLDTITGSATLATTDGSAKLIVTFPTAPAPIEYWVLDTDYDSYSLVYSCVNLNANQRQVWSWKMSRTRSLTTNATSAINQVVNSVQVLNNRYYEVINNTDADCFYFPTPNGNPVRFRGQCDDTIPAVANFNAVAYMGLWYDIESYPQVFQEGTCSTATYSLIPEGVNVFNTQVVNQRLDTITGLAVVASTDGSAKLSVNFPIAGTNFTVDSPYWVLSTDYTNYALVYACVNLTSDSRSVSSWKLSRTRTLANSSEVAINNVINTIPVLSQQYYENKNHTDAGCFYFPEPVAGEPVIFPGQCDNNIQAVPNFNITQFLGTWHEIEAYPKDDQTGQCVNHVYTAGTGNTLNLQSSSVTDQLRNITSSSVAFSSNDGSGRLVITITSNGQQIQIPFWILNTDYADYALAYSCINVNANFRAVNSWKLSRTQQLSTAANTAINAAMTNIDVLDNVYFENINQSSDACFYLPELPLGVPVVMVGQCDMNINVVQNFNAARYSGRWFDIESYFDDYEGDCIDGTFTQSAAGYNVLFSQVVNQTLDTTNSIATISNDGSGRLIVTANNASIEYWILSTDYDNYSLVYSCQNLTPESRRVLAWKMSRTRELTNTSRIAINNVVDSVNVLNDRFFSVRDHSDDACFYYPEHVSGQSVTFRGQCDLSIPAVANFNVAAYLGLWYDIESYPQEFQAGATCATATYSLGAAGVDVFNTQVVAQVLDTINGTAVVDSDDGSAKLLVTFPIAGTNMTIQTPYWVLATDYTTYSLVYTCVNVNSETRRVTSWKLSRTTNLTNAAAVAINAVMTTVPVIRQQYFEETGHSDDDCFFYPQNFGGPVILDGQCPLDNQIAAVANFNAASFAGTWHEVSRFPSELQSNECASTTYTVTNPNTFNIAQSSVADERLVTASGPGTLSSDGRGVITANLTGSGQTASLDLYILGTDYSEYALAYRCVNLPNNQKQIFSWKLARSRTGLSQAANNQINAIVSNNVDLFEGYYEDTDQSNRACFYYPEFNPLPDAIELPGPCDATITGIPNFSAANYLGRWFETARYPQADQAGACNRAEYSLGNGVVDVYNTQVVDQVLQSQAGSAVVASTDGTGLLNVTFVVNGVTNYATYYILDTDYTNFALVYNCRNLTNGNRQVFSWKLSRERTLSTQSNNAINRVINNTQGLLEGYYMPTNQSDEACFYIPEFNATDNVVFRGQCDGIVGMQGFDIQRYLGWWHEIERYPTNENVGECTSSQFSASGNQILVVDTGVFGLAALFGNAYVEASASGLLRRVQPNGDIVDQWVLATDYETYSLLLSCQNVGTEYRRVWSAKHSKTRQLTVAAQNAMAPIIEANEVLHTQFYMQVNQSDSSCFHYPDVGQQVILPGQCDDNIPVVQNFDAGAYTGTWYQIERYPQIHESGNCTGARYSLNEGTGVVTLLNWEVVNGVLETIEGNATISSSDGSAKLTVVLPVVGSETGQTSTTSLYVLTTDYVSYALSYSCVDVTNFTRQVGVWKISRSRTMPAAGTEAINAYMASREELYQNYFIQVGQSDDCQSPSSGFVFKSSIIVVLICGILQLF